RDFNGDACNTHWLFPDGVRRPVFLRLGYELRGDEPYLDRVVQFRNPSGNPPFDGPMSVIGGFVVTRWPDPHPLKSLDRWIRPEQGELFDPAHGVNFAPGTWNDHQLQLTEGDEVFGWIGQPISLSAYPAEVAGQTAHLDHIGPSDNDDVGFCLCKVHGGIEMGGGLLHGGISLPVASDSLSIEARRRLTLPGDPLSVQTYVYEAETDLFHGTGAPGGAGGWSANTADHLPAHMIYGPYVDEWIGVSGEAAFTILIDNNDANSEGVLTLDVYDATAGQILASQEVSRDDFNAPFVYQDFLLSFALDGLEGHAMETRVYWKANAYIEVDKVTVNVSSL
ncbi:MAG: hypothetical protein VX938_02330, partial [Myxococcota bacterium]|nr:hypothetical protein [Myxococcota bacterium]